MFQLTEAERRFLMRTDWGFVHQNPADGLRMAVSAGANVGERLMAVGDRHYGNIRAHLESRGQTIGVNDLHIAAHARSEGLTLVSNNLREFERVEALQLANWAI